MRREHLPTLTGLRFLAALWVVLYHADLFFWAHPLIPASGMWWPLHTSVDEGYLGVNLFFLLSGFILATVYLDGAGHLMGGLRAYAAGRVGRIVPVYLLSLALAWTFTDLHGHPLATGLATLLLLHAWLPWYPLLWNSVGWTLSDEAAFYTLFPRLGPRLSRIRHAYLPWCSITICCVGSGKDSRIRPASALRRCFLVCGFMRAAPPACAR